MLVLLCALFTARAQKDSGIRGQEDTFIFQTDTSYLADSLRSDSLFYGISQHGKSFSLLDTLSNDSLLEQVFRPYQFITNRYVEKLQVRRELPTAKEVIERNDRNRNRNNQWKFWVILFILAYISFVRISNPNNFRVFVLSVFNLKLSGRIWEDQRSIFGFVILQLFAIYLFIAALFVTVQLELKNVHYYDDYFIQYLVVVGVLLVTYALKFILHTALGLLLKMKKLAIGFVSNTISVNNFIALAIFPFIIFMIYNYDPLWSTVLSRTVIAIFFVSVAYRLIRIFLLSSSFFSFPRIYLILYLCALEILPWFVIIKFINTARF